MPDKPAKKRRRVRPAEITVREQAGKSQENQTKSRGQAARTLGPVFKPVAFVFRPIRWLGRHIIPGYIKNSFRELKFVTWPNRKESRQLTTAVILFAIVFGVMVSLIDLGLDKVFKKVFLKE